MSVSTSHYPTALSIIMLSLLEFTFLLTVYSADFASIHLIHRVIHTIQRIVVQFWHY